MSNPDSPTVESLLCDLLAAYCKKESLPLMSADDLLRVLWTRADYPQRPAHAAWLDAYCKLWEASAL